MANKVFKGIRMPGLNDFYVLPEAVAIEDENGFVEIKSYISDTVEVENIDTTLTQEGLAADAKAVGEALKDKAPKSYILHGTYDYDTRGVLLTNFNWDELLAAITSEEHIYIAVRATDADGYQYEYAFSDYVSDENHALFIRPSDGCYEWVRIWADGTVEGGYKNYQPSSEFWTFTLEDGSTVVKKVYVG